jgi:hypothetical protein
MEAPIVDASWATERVAGKAAGHTHGLPCRLLKLCGRRGRRARLLPVKPRRPPRDPTRRGQRARAAQRGVQDQPEWKQAHPELVNEAEPAVPPEGRPKKRAPPERVERLASEGGLLRRCMSHSRAKTTM